MLSYHDLLAKTAITINALVGTDPVELQVTYSTRPLIDELFDSSIFPMNAIRDALIEAEGRLARAISFSADHSLRSYLRGVSAALASGVALPKVDSASVPVIGNYGAVYDQGGVLMTRQPLAIVRNRLLAPALYLAPAYYYALDGATILHTRTTVTMECCVYSASAQTAAFDADGPILLPDAWAEAYVNGACVLLVRDDEFTTQAQLFAQYFATSLASIPPAPMEAIAA